MTQDGGYDTAAIDAVANLWTHDGIKTRPDWSASFFGGKLGQDPDIVKGMSEGEYLQLMDGAGIERALLAACKAGPYGHPPGYQIPYETIAAAVRRHPSRFSALAGIEEIRAAYRHAVEQRYRFFSYGDAMLIL